MYRSSLLVVTAAILLEITGAAQDRPDFSGVWKMDAARSESAHQDVPIGPVSLVIRQTAADLVIETRKSDRKASAVSTETVTYKLDGTESTSVGSSGSPIKASAHWDGSNLVTETARTLQGMSFTTLYVLSLGANGRELTIRKTLTVQHGYQGQGAKSTGTGTDIFVKVKR